MPNTQSQIPICLNWLNQRIIDAMNESCTEIPKTLGDSLSKCLCGSLVCLQRVCLCMLPRFLPRPGLVLDRSCCLANCKSRTQKKQSPRKFPYFFCKPQVSLSIAQSLRSWNFHVIIRPIDSQKSSLSLQSLSRFSVHYSYLVAETFRTHRPCRRRTYRAQITWTQRTQRRVGDAKRRLRPRTSQLRQARE